MAEYDYDKYFTSSSVEEESSSDYDYDKYFISSEEEVNLDNVDYATKAAYGIAQETTIGGNVFRMAKAAVSAGTSDESWTEALANLEKERQEEIDQMFPSLANLEESEEDLAILSGRLGVAVADPVTFFMPWAKAAKGASIASRVAKTGALGAGVSAADTALREKVVYGDVNLANVGVATAFGAGSSVLGLSAMEGINFAKNKFRVSKALEDIEPNAAAKQEMDIYADITDLNAQETASVTNALKNVLGETDDDLLSITSSNSLMPQYREAMSAIDVERNKINKLLKDENLNLTKEQIEDFTRKKNRLSSKKAALKKKLIQDTIELTEKKNAANLKALEDLAGTEKFTTKAGRAILQEVTRPAVGAIGGGFFGTALREDVDDTETIYASMLIGAGIGAATRRIENSTIISSMNKQKATMVLGEAAKKNINTTVKLLNGQSTSERMEKMGGWNKTIGSLLLQKFGSNVDSVEGRTLRKQSEWVGILNERMGVSGKDNNVLEVVGESMFGFTPTNLVGYKGIRGDLKPLTKEQADEVTRITPLFREAQDAMKERGKKSGITFEELDFYGMSIRHDYSKTRNSKELEAHKADLKEAAKIQNKNAGEDGKKINPTGYANSVLDMTTTKAGKYVPSGRGPSPFVYDAKGKVVKFRKAADFFEQQRTLTDPEAIKYLASKGRILLNARDVVSDYGKSSLKVFEFTDVFGPNGEIFDIALKDIRKTFKGASSTLDQIDPGEQYTKQLTGTIEAYWGGYSHGAEQVLKKSTSAFVALANTTYLTGVSLANIVDLANPIIKSGVWPSMQTVLQKVGGKSKSQMSHFKYDQSYERELDTLLASKSPSQQGKTARITDFTNRNFFYLVGLKKVNQVARNWAYDVGVNRAFNISRKKKFSKVDINEIESLGLNVDDIKNIAKYSNVEEAFEKQNARSTLDLAGRAAAERDAIVPNVSNRLLFTMTNTPTLKATGQFLSWAQGKSAEVNAMISRIEDGDTRTLVRLAAATPILVGYEQMRQYITSNDAYYDREPEDELLDAAEEIATGVRRSGLVMDWKRDWLYDFIKYNSGILGNNPDFNATDALAPTLSLIDELGGATISAGKNIKSGDFEGAAKDIVEVIPLGKPTLKIIKSATGKPLLIDEDEEKEDEVVQFNKGGEVLDVPNAPQEPDERIDKMTGMPYDKQAGTAFVDEEDPLRRLGFVGGGSVDPLKRLGFGV